MITTIFIYVMGFLMNILAVLPSWDPWPASIHLYFIKFGSWFAWLSPWWDIPNSWLCTLTLISFLVIWFPFKITQRVFRVKILKE